MTKQLSSRLIVTSTEKKKSLLAHLSSVFKGRKDTMSLRGKTFLALNLETNLFTANIFILLAEQSYIPTSLFILFFGFKTLS